MSRMYIVAKCHIVQVIRNNLNFKARGLLFIYVSILQNYLLRLYLIKKYNYYL